MKTKIVIRKDIPSDRSYILDTMHKTLLESSAYCYHVSPQTIHLLIEPILATYNILVATPEDDDSTVLGYIVYDNPQIVGWIYVRSQFRSEPLKDGTRKGGGIARSLLVAAGVRKSEISCPLTVTGLKGENFARLADKKGYRLRFRPYIPLEIASNLYQMR